MSKHTVEDQQRRRLVEIEERVARIDRMIDQRQREIRFLEGVRESPDLLDDIFGELMASSMPVAKELAAIPAAAARAAEVPAMKLTDEALRLAIIDVVPHGQKARVATLVHRLRVKGHNVSEREVDRILKSDDSFETRARGWWSVHPSAIPF